MAWTEKKLQTAIDLLPHVLGGMAVVLDVPADELEAWVIDGVDPIKSQTETVETAVNSSNRPRTYKKGPTLKSRLIEVVENHPDWHCARVAEHLGVSRGALSGTASLCGIKFPPKPQTSLRVIDKIRKSQEKNPNCTAREIAEQWGLRPANVNGAAKQAGVKIFRVAGTNAKPIGSPKPQRKAPLPVRANVARQANGTRFYLRNDDGEYLHQSCEGLTQDRTYAWRGLAGQLLVTRRKFPLAKDLFEEVAL